MSVETYIHAIPKVDLNVQFEGAVHRELVLMFAEQTDIAGIYKKRREYDKWVAQFKEPDFSNIDTLVREVYGWVRHPEDLERAVYDLGVALHKQNIEYAEISITPSIYNATGLSFPDFLSAITDGADKVLRAWKVQINWIFAIPREQPRRADETARWATGATAQRSNVVGLSLIGREDEQPIAQFQKAFSIAEKKALYRQTHALSGKTGEAFNDLVEYVNPNRLHDVWELLENGDALSYVIEHDIPVIVTPTREVKLGRISSIAEYPVKELLDNGVNLVISSGMSELLNTSLEAEYTALVTQAGLSTHDIETLVLNSVRASFLASSEKEAMLKRFSEAFDTLKSEHLD